MWKMLSILWHNYNFFGREIVHVNHAPESSIIKYQHRCETLITLEESTRICNIFGFVFGWLQAVIEYIFIWI